MCAASAFSILPSVSALFSPSLVHDSDQYAIPWALKRAPRSLQRPAAYPTSESPMWTTEWTFERSITGPFGVGVIVATGVGAGAGGGGGARECSAIAGGVAPPNPKRVSKQTRQAR